MKKDFMKAFMGFAVQRQEVIIFGNESIKQEYQVSINEVIRLEDVLMARMGGTKEAYVLVNELSQATGRITGIRSESSYLQGMRDAYAFMEMIKGGSAKND